MSVRFKSSRTALFIAFVIAAATVSAISLYSAGTQSARADTGLSPVSKPSAPSLPEPDPFSDDRPARGKFLVASPGLSDPRFQETVVLLIDYGTEGSAGIIINRPTKVPLAELLPSVPGLRERTDVAYYGGPVEVHRMLMLIRSGERPEESGRVFGNVYVSASRNALERAIGSGRTEKQMRVYAGYAGWTPRQLDYEIARGDWIIMSADARFIFEKKPSEVWLELQKRGAAIQVRSKPASGPALLAALSPPH